MHCVLYLRVINSKQQSVFLGHSAIVHSQLLKLNACVCIRKLQRAVIGVLRSLKNQISLKLINQHFTRVTLINIIH